MADISNILPYPDRNGTKSRFDGGGKPPDDPGMEQRLSAVEQSIARIDAVLPTLATKVELVELRGEMKEGFQALRSDFHKGQNDLVKWMIGTAVGLGVAAITVMTFVLNNAVPKAAPTQPTAPVIVNMAPQAAPTAPAPSPPAAKP